MHSIRCLSVARSVMGENSLFPCWPLAFLRFSLASLSSKQVIPHRFCGWCEILFRYKCGTQYCCGEGSLFHADASLSLPGQGCHRLSINLSVLSGTFWVWNRVALCLMPSITDSGLIRLRGWILFDHPVCRSFAYSCWSDSNRNVSPGGMCSCFSAYYRWISSPSWPGITAIYISSAFYASPSIIFCEIVFNTDRWLTPCRNGVWNHRAGQTPCFPWRCIRRTSKVQRVSECPGKLDIRSFPISVFWFLLPFYIHYRSRAAVFQQYKPHIFRFCFK